MPGLSEARFAPETWNEEERTIELVWTTGARGRRGYYKRYYESLSLDEGHVRLERLNKRAPLLSAHNGWSNRAVIGQIMPGTARIEDGEGRCTARLSQADSAADDVFKIREGILVNCSVGYDVYEYEVTQREGELDEYRAVDWEPYEVSIVPMPFDMDSQVRSLRGHDPDQPAPPEFFLPEQERTMPPEKTETDTPADNVVDLEKVTREAEKNARAAEKQRITGIRATATKLEVTDEELVTRLIDGNVSVDEARKQLIDAHAEKAEEHRTDPHFGAGDQDELDKRLKGMEDALCYRAKPRQGPKGKETGFEETEQGKAYRHYSLIDVCTDLLHARGVRELKRRSKYEIARMALQMRSAIATGDFSDLTVSTARRVLRQGYTEVNPVYQMFAGKRDTPDFKQTKELVFGGLGTPQLIPEGGEFKHVSETLGGKAWELSTYGHKMALTLQAILSDDLSAFQRKSFAFGQAARRLENKMFFDLLLSNPTTYDGAAMFSAARGNVVAGGSANDPSKTQYSLMEAILGKQTGMDADEDLDLEMEYVLGGRDQRTNMQSMRVQLTPDTTANAVPPEMRDYVPVNTARIDRTDGDLYFGCVSPAQVEAFIYAHLRGMEGPAVEQENAWNSLAVEWRAYNFFAVSAIDHRGWVINDQNNTIIP